MKKLQSPHTKSEVMALKLMEIVLEPIQVKITEAEILADLRYPGKPS